MDAQIFQKLYKPPQSARYQKDDTKQIPFLGTTNIRRHRNKFSHPGDIVPWICGPL